MNFDQHKIDAASRAKFCRRSVLVRMLAAASLFGCLAAPALAGDKERPQQARQERRQEVQAAREAQQRQAEPLRNDTRQFSYEARPDEQRRAAPVRQDPAQGRQGGRLTPDERRDLRRQINEAGNDIYRNAPRR